MTEATAAQIGRMLAKFIDGTITEADLLPGYSLGAQKGGFTLKTAGIIPDFGALHYHLPARAQGAPFTDDTD